MRRIEHNRDARVAAVTAPLAEHAVPAVVRIPLRLATVGSKRDDKNRRTAGVVFVANQLQTHIVDYP